MSGNDELEEELLELLEEEALEAARESLLAFTLYTFDGDFDVNWHHRLLAEKLEQFARGEVKRLIICMPPRHGKSELASRRLPAYILGRNPDAEIIACSYALDLALDMSRDAKRIVMSEEYGRVFPATSLSATAVVTNAKQAYKNTADQWQVVGRKGQYLARGVGGGITGKGGKYLIVDDPVKDDKQAQSEVEREGIWRWYTKVFKTRAAKGAGILVIMTRWHEQDLVGKLLDQAKNNPKADQWEELKLPAIAEESDTHPGDPREPGEALWPEFRGEDEWSSIKAEDPAGFAALGQQRPAPEGGYIIKTDWTKERWKVLPAGPAEWIWSCDPKAGSKDPKSSRAVIQLWARFKAKPGFVYLVDQMRGLWEIDDTLEQFRLAAKLPLWRSASAKIVENKADGKGIIKLLRSEIPGLIAVEPQGNKEVRCRAVAPFWRAGNIIIPDDSVHPWVSEFVHELTTFPGAANDDQVDAMSMALSYLLIEPEEEDPVAHLRRITGRN
ncbi:MAG: phage terminase large subunit [Bradymonadaceae bacterium]